MLTDTAIAYCLSQHPRRSRQTVSQRLVQRLFSCTSCPLNFCPHPPARNVRQAALALAAGENLKAAVAGRLPLRRVGLTAGVTDEKE